MARRTTTILPSPDKNSPSKPRPSPPTAASWPPTRAPNLRLREHRNRQGASIAQTGDQKHFLCMTFSPDGKKLATADADGNIAIYDTKSWEPGIGHHEWSLLDLEFSPDSKTLLVSVVFPRGFVFLWDVASGRLRKPIRVFEEMEGCPAHFAPDGKMLVCRGYARVRFVDIATDKLVKEWNYTLKDGSKGWAVSPDRKTVAIGNLLLDWQSGKVATTIPISGGDLINNMAYSTNGSYLAYSGNDRSVKLWDTTSSKERLTLTGHTSPILLIAFSRSGQYILTHSLDKVKLWRGTPGGG